MKISCQSCQAKYAVADEKVIGKVVKIRCKKCNATIVVDGRTGAAAPIPIAAPDTIWMVHLASEGEVQNDEGQQVEMATTSLIAAYRQGRVDDATYCWKDGMADWLPFAEIGELVSALRGSSIELSEAGVRPIAASAEGFERASVLPASTFGGSRIPGPTGTGPLPQTEPPPAGYSPRSEPDVWRPSSPPFAPEFTPHAPPADAAYPSPFLDAPPAALFQNPAEMVRQQSRPSYPHITNSQPGSPSSGSMRFGVDGAAVELPVNDDPRTSSVNIPSMRAPQSHGNTLLGPSSTDLLNRLSGPPSEPSPFAQALAGNPDIKMTGERGESSVLFSLAAVKGEAPPPAPSESNPGENSGMIDMRALMNARAQNPKHAPVPGGRVDDIMNLSPGGLLAGSLAPPVLSSATGAPTQTATIAPATESASGSTGLLLAGVCVLVVGIVAALGVGAYTLKLRSAAPVPTTTPSAAASTIVTAPAASSAVPSASSVAIPAAPAFNLQAAKTELGKIAAAIGTCKKAGGPTGKAEVVLTFSNDGKVASAKVSGTRFEKTAVGDCIEQRFSEGKIPAFGGAPQPATKIIEIK